MRKAPRSQEPKARDQGPERRDRGARQRKAPRNQNPKLEDRVKGAGPKFRTISSAGCQVPAEPEVQHLPHKTQGFNSRVPFGFVNRWRGRFPVLDSEFRKIQ